MARRIITNLIDDLDGTPAERTVQFMLDGIVYEIDLSATNERRLRKALEPYLAAGTKTTPHRRRHVPPQRRRGPVRHVPMGLTTKAGREAARLWGRRNGWPDISDRGRLPADLAEAYEKHLATAGSGR